MTKYILSYVVTLIFFLAIDLVWLGWIARPLYVAEIGSLLRKEPKLIAAATFYLMFAAGLMAFAVIPGLNANSATHAMLFGALLGLVAYGTYDLTNLAVLNGYTVRMAIVDLVWGTVLSGVTAALAVLLIRMVFGE